MRFCMITTFYPPYSYGGDATYVRALARGLVERGHDVHVISNTDAYALRSAAHPDICIDNEDGVIVHRLRSAFSRLAPLIVQQTSRPGMYSLELKKILAQRFDVLHFHNISLVGGLGVLAMGDAALKLYSLHEHWLFCAAHILWKNGSKRCDGATCLSCSIRSGIPPQIWRYFKMRDRYLGQVDRIFSSSHFTADLHRRAGITQTIDVLPLFSGIPANCFDPAQMLPKRARPLFLFVGRVTASKGIEGLLRVAATMTDMDFMIVGEGDLRSKLMKIYGPARNINFVGPIAQFDLARVYASATALVLPSLAPETFGLGIVEASQFGTPAIVHREAGGGAEIVEGTGGGITYRNDAELVEALRALSADGDLRDRLGERARVGYLSEYTPDRHFDTYLSRVHSLMAAKAAERQLSCAQ